VRACVRACMHVDMLTFSS